MPVRGIQSLPRYAKRQSSMPGQSPPACLSSSAWCPMRGRSLQTANKLHVIGIGYRPLEKRANEILGKAEAILASNRLAEVFGRYDEYQVVKDRIKLINKVPETVVVLLLILLRERR